MHNIKMFFEIKDRNKYFKFKTETLFLIVISKLYMKSPISPPKNVILSISRFRLGFSEIGCTEPVPSNSLLLIIEANYLFSSYKLMK